MRRIRLVAVLILVSIWITASVPASAIGEDVGETMPWPVEFTATWEFGPDLRAGIEQRDGHVVAGRGYAWQPLVVQEASDPRLRGDLLASRQLLPPWRCAWSHPLEPGLSHRERGGRMAAAAQPLHRLALRHALGFGRSPRRRGRLRQPDRHLPQRHRLRRRYLPATRLHHRR